KMHKALNSFRVFPLGQDRFRRNYWVLPNCGGVFVEGMESGEPGELANNFWAKEELEAILKEEQEEEAANEESKPLVANESESEKKPDGEEDQIKTESSETNGETKEGET